MDETTYSLEQLEAETGQNKRKIRYYIHAVIGSGQGTGGRNAQYPKSVRDKLLFIGKVQELASNLTLAEIKEIIESVSDNDIARVADGKEPLEVADIRRAEGIRDFAMYTMSANRRQKVVAVSLDGMDSGEAKDSVSDYVRRVREDVEATPRPPKEEWKTIRLTNDVELRVRGEFSPKQREQLKLLGQFVKSILVEGLGK